jgi:hypothetical protein
MHTLSSLDHKEARRLTWKSRHIPFGTLFAASWIATAVMSAVLTILAQSPANPIP